MNSVSIDVVVFPTSAASEVTTQCFYKTVSATCASFAFLDKCPNKWSCGAAWWRTAKVEFISSRSCE